MKVYSAGTEGIEQIYANNSLIKEKLGWKAKITIKKGLIEYCEYYKKEVMPLENKLF